MIINGCKIYKIYHTSSILLPKSIKYKARQPVTARTTNKVYIIHSMLVLSIFIQNEFIGRPFTFTGEE